MTCRSCWAAAFLLVSQRHHRVLGIRGPGPVIPLRMAEFARGTGLEVEVATFEAWESAGRTFDAVVSGTAWHWVDSVAGAAKAARVLRPKGGLAPFGHVYQLPPTVAEALLRRSGGWLPTLRWASTAGLGRRSWTPTMGCTPGPRTESARWSTSGHRFHSLTSIPSMTSSWNSPATHTASRLTPSSRNPTRAAALIMAVLSVNVSTWRRCRPRITKP